MLSSAHWMAEPLYLLQKRRSTHYSAIHCGYDSKNTIEFNFSHPSQTLHLFLEFIRNVPGTTVEEIAAAAAAAPHPNAAAELMLLLLGQSFMAHLIWSLESLVSSHTVA